MAAASSKAMISCRAPFAHARQPATALCYLGARAIGWLDFVFGD
jgi:hypothetical protein